MKATQLLHELGQSHLLDNMTAIYWTAERSNITALSILRH